MIRTFSCLRRRPKHGYNYGEQQILCIAPLRHRFSELQTGGADELVGKTYYGSDSAFNRWLEQAFERTGTVVPTSIEVSASPALIEVVRLGVGVGLVESAALSPEIRPSLVVRPFVPELRIRSRVLRLSGRPMSRYGVTQSGRWRSTGQRSTTWWNEGRHTLMRQHRDSYLPGR